MGRKSMTGKITGLLLAMASASMLLLGGVSAWSLHSMKTISAESSRELGELAADDAEAELEKMAGEQLLYTAMEKAAYIDEKFRAVEAYVRGIAAQAQMIYENPEQFPDREIPLPVKGSRSLAPQLLRSEKLGVPTCEEAAEIRKLGNLQDLLVQYNANNAMVSSAYLATESGWMIQADYIAASKYSSDSELPDFYEAENRPWYRLASRAAEGELVYTGIIQDIHEGKDSIVCAQPVFRKGELAAVAGVGSYLDTVEEAVLGTTVGEAGYAFLTGKEGQVVMSPKKEGETAAYPGEAADLRAGENKELAEAVSDVLEGGSGLKKLLLDGRSVYLAYAPLESLGWGFLTVMEEAEVLAPAVAGQRQILALGKEAAEKQNEAIQRTFWLFAVILGAAACAIGFSGMALGKRIAEPIRRLTREVGQLEGGNLDYRISLKTGDEVEALGNAFNRMMEQRKTYIGNLAAVTAEKERIRTELELAARLQADMLPESEGAFPDREEFTLYASMLPAREVGGDFYDFFLADEDHLVMVAADVSGKGVPAALFMVVAKTLIRSHVASPEHLAESVAETNELLCANNKNGMFVTAWIGVLNLQNGMLTYVNAGHCRPLIRQNGIYGYRTELGGFVLAGMEGMHYEQTSIQLEPGDMIFQYSDGVTETHDAQRNLYGEGRLEAYLNAKRERDPKQLVNSVWEDITRFQGTAEQYDDITMLAVRYDGPVLKMNIREPNSDRLPEVLAFAEGQLKRKGFPQKETGKVLTAVDEIFTNICRYSKAGEVILSCQASESEARVIVEDDGIHFHPLERTDPDISADLERRPVGGLGIYLVKKIMDHISYEYEEPKKRNKLTMIKKAEEG